MLHSTIPSVVDGVGRIGIRDTVALEGTDDGKVIALCKPKGEKERGTDKELYQLSSGCKPRRIEALTIGHAVPVGRVHSSGHISAVHGSGTASAEGEDGSN